MSKLLCDFYKTWIFQKSPSRTFYCIYAPHILILYSQVEESASKDDLLAMDESAKTGTFFTVAKPSTKNKAAVFTLNNRNSVLNKDLEAPLIVTHTAEEKNEKVEFYS